MADIRTQGLTAIEKPFEPKSQAHRPPNDSRDEDPYDKGPQP